MQVMHINIKILQQLPWENVKLRKTSLWVDGSCYLGICLEEVKLTQTQAEVGHTDV